MNLQETIKKIEAARVAYTGFALSHEEKTALPVGTRYFKAIFDDAEGVKDAFGYYRTFKDAAKACKAFAKVELEYFYDEEFDIYEYEVTNENGKFKGILQAKYTNDSEMKFIQYR